jgi:hypothetical protein
MLRSISFGGIFFLFSTQLSAQWRVVPLESQGYPTTTHKTTNTVNSKKITALTLPFFDDFSTVSGKPDVQLWQSGGGVRVDNKVNTQFQPPSKGVAHFDGVNFSGVPYSDQLQLAQGSTDTLLSLPIDLSGLTISNNVYLSFFYQAKGLGEAPDASDGDSLKLELLDNTGKWRKIWDVAGESLAAFKQVTVNINSNDFFHAGFQFRFRAIGKQSGIYDSWVLDYVYLNKNRTATDVYYRDLSPSFMPNPILKRYTAMPFFEFFANKATETSDTVKTFLNNNNNVFNFAGWTVNLKNAVTNQVYDFTTVASQRIEAGERKMVVYRPNASNIPVLTQSTLLKTDFIFNTGDNNTVIPGVDFRQNDTISTLTSLGNEFAYDDGIPDYAGGINQRLGKVALQFKVSAKRRLTGVKFYLPQIGRSLVGQTFVLGIWGDDNGKPGTAIFQKSVSIDTLNQFKFYPFLEKESEVVFVEGIFYVGWQQVATIEQMNVGIDKSHDAGQYLFYNLGGSDWSANKDAPVPLTGSFMIRPVLSTEVISGVEEELFADFIVYPNPAQDVLNWNYDNVKSVQIVNTLGQLVTTIHNPVQKNISVSHLQNGLYVVQFQIGKNKVSRKVVISR